MPGPHANFACLSPKCSTKRGAKVYDLPTTATHCPQGHKRLRRLYDAINVASGMARRLDRTVEPAYEQATKGKRAAKAARERAATEVRQSPALAVPIKNIASTLGAMGRNVTMDGSRPSAVPATPTLAALRGRPARPMIPPGGRYDPPKEAMP